MIKRILEPKILSLVTTDKCTSACKNCCFKCNQRLAQTMSLDKIKFWIDESTNTFSDIISCVFTGGECTLLGKDLCEAIKYSHSKHLKNRIVSNGHWATSESDAVKYLSKLKESGLDELNLSTGDEHQKWVPYERIVYACTAAANLGIFTAVNIENTPKSLFNSTVMLNDDRVSELIKSRRIVIKDSLWIDFNKSEDNTSTNTCALNEGPCTNIFNTITISPQSHLLACCGITCRESRYLDLGDALKYPIGRLYDEQFDDLLKLWLYTHGPKDIYTFLCKEKGITDNSCKYPHICSLCHHIMDDDSNMTIIKSNVSNILPTVMFKFQFINCILN